MQAPLPLARPARRRWPLLIALPLLAACLVASFAVVLLNGGPLFYFDSLGYFDQGTSMLRLVVPDAWLVQAPAFDPSSDAGPTAGPTAASPASATPASAPTVNGSRSAVFSLLLASLYHTHLLGLYPVIAALAVLGALWLPMRVARRQNAGAPALPWLVGVPLLAAAAGALPFYIAYLMPDIFAPVLILVCAALVAFGPDMRRGELALAAALGMIAVLAHPSHLLIVAGMVPVVVLGSLVAAWARGGRRADGRLGARLRGRRGWWIAPLVVAALAAGGAGERLLFRSAVQGVAKSEVTYYPYLTARFIADGPGLAYLAAHCPDAGRPTCLLHAALSQSDDPMRLSATHIVFEDSPRLGSFRRMPKDDQRRVVADQSGFVRAVMLDDPLGVAASLWRNTLEQARRNSIEMTIPSPESVARLVRLLPGSGLEAGRLIADRAWLPPVEAAHRVVYALSLAVVGLLLVWPGRVAWQIRLFAGVVLLGILANAFVCGAVSQPANRYGARVIWLLPMLAALMALFALPQPRQREDRA